MTNWPSSFSRGAVLLSLKGETMTENTKTTQTKKNSVSDEILLKTSKEIAVKFIEMGRITPTNFQENFKVIHTTLKETVNND